MPVDAPLSSWLVILLAALAANMPFVSERLLGVVPIGLTVKPIWLRLIELTFLYFFVGAIAYALEARISNVFPQRWEFYAVTFCLFLVFAYPGFVFRYLKRPRE